MNEKQNAFSWLIRAPQAVPIIGIGVYVSGFVANNIHLSKYGVFDFDLINLSKYGVFDFDLINTRYLIVGVLFLIFLASWYLFAGRAIISTKEWLDKPKGEPNSYRMLLDAVINVTFSICKSSALFSLIFLENTEPIMFCIYSVCLFLITPRWENFWETRALYRRFPFIDRTLEPVVRIVGIVIFLTTISISSQTIIVFFHFSLISAYSNFALDSFKWSWDSKERFTQTIIHSIFLVLLSSALFGWLQYGHIKSGFGGGQLQPVEIKIVEKTVSKSLKEMGFEVTPSFKVNLVYENQQELILSTRGKTILLSKTAIAGIKVLSVKPGIWERYFGDLISKLQDAWSKFRLKGNQ